MRDAGSVLAIAASVVLSCAGCTAGRGDGTATAPRAGTSLPGPVTVAASPEPTDVQPLPDDDGTGREAAAAVLAARVAWSEEMGVPVADVTLVEVEPVVWPDSALGCPRPDQMYLQVLTPGYRVTVSGGGETATYHTNRTSPPAVVRCDGPGGPEAPVPDR